MYVYLPVNRPAAPALVVALHGCTQSADDSVAYSGWRELADRDGFVLVLPEQSITNNLNRCFNWFEDNDIRRGSGEALSVIQMIDAALGVQPGPRAGIRHRAIRRWGHGGRCPLGDLSRCVRCRGGGGRAALRLRHLADRGIRLHESRERPHAVAVGAAGARGFSGYSGPYPRVAIWHGTADATVSPR